MTKNEILKLVNEYLREKGYPEEVKARFNEDILYVHYLLVIDNIHLIPQITAKEILLEATGIEGIKDFKGENKITITYDKITKEFTFGQALEYLKDGKKVARKGWNGKNMFLFLLPAGEIPKSAIHDPKLKEVLENNGKDSFTADACIRMKTAQDTIQTGWLASQADMLAEDWVLNN